MKEDKSLQPETVEVDNELRIESRARHIGGLVGVFVTLVLMLVEQVILGREVNYGYFLIIVASAAALFIYKACRLKKPGDIVLAVIWFALTVYSVVMLVFSYL